MLCWFPYLSLTASHGIRGPQGTRKHLPVDWRKRLRAIQAAASTELETLPAQLSTDAAVDYFAALAIRSSLAEDADKGLFGGLKGAAGTWDKLVKAYEKQSQSCCTLRRLSTRRSLKLNPLLADRTQAVLCRHTSGRGWQHPHTQCGF